MRERSRRFDGGDGSPPSSGDDDALLADFLRRTSDAGDSPAGSLSASEDAATM